MKKFPSVLKKYFWDINLSKLNPKVHFYFIIERILEYGNKGAVSWMKERYSQKQIKNVLFSSRNLSPKSANFWRIIFDLDKSEILCLKKSFRKKHNLLWKY
jgi:hypothetical protein